MNRLARFAAVVLGVPPLAIAQGSGIAGDWLTPEHAVVRVAACGAEYCASLVQLSPDTVSRVDGKNPDPAKRAQRLCGLQIGYGFHLTDPAHADEGHVYDPQSGKTYHGTMSSENDKLFLRGYIGVKAFGRTETWTRLPRPAAVCS